MTGPFASRLPGDRLHLQHGPIDLIIGADGGREMAFRAAWGRFQSVLTELVAELPLLRRPVGENPNGVIARRMVAATRPHDAVFVTPMAAVAGAVAQDILSVMVAATPLTRAYVNNGGDIALHLSAGHSYRLAVASPGNQPLGHIRITHTDPVRGIATSGQGGRSFSFGIADAVTVLARTAAQADVAATLIANAVDLPGHPAIVRRPANSLQHDTDLGARLVVTQVGPLTEGETETALSKGEGVARLLRTQRHIHAAALFLNGQSRIIGAGLTGISRGSCGAPAPVRRGSVGCSVMGPELSECSARPSGCEAPALGGSGAAWNATASRAVLLSGDERGRPDGLRHCARTIPLL